MPTTQWGDLMAIKPTEKVNAPMVILPDETDTEHPFQGVIIVRREVVRRNISDGNKQNNIERKERKAEERAKGQKDWKRDYGVVE